LVSRFRIQWHLAILDAGTVNSDGSSRISAWVKVDPSDEQHQNLGQQPGGGGWNSAGFFRSTENSFNTSDHRKLDSGKGEVSTVCVCVGVL